MISNRGGKKKKNPMVTAMMGIIIKPIIGHRNNNPATISRI
jgi:hypothetical protein